MAFLSINCFVNLKKENPACFLPRTISICLYFAQSRLYKRFNFEVEVSLGKFSKQVCITSQSGRPTREIWRKEAIQKIPNWKYMWGKSEEGKNRTKGNLKKKAQARENWRKRQLKKSKIGSTSLHNLPHTNQDFLAMDSGFLDIWRNTVNCISFILAIVFLAFYIFIVIAHFWIEKQCPWFEWDAINHDFELGGKEPRSHVLLCYGTNSLESRQNMSEDTISPSSSSLKVNILVAF